MSSPFSSTYGVASPQVRSVATHGSFHYPRMSSRSDGPKNSPGHPLLIFHFYDILSVASIQTAQELDMGWSSDDKPTNQGNRREYMRL
jgi:hypothetical protein